MIISDNKSIEQTKQTSPSCKRIQRKSALALAAAHMLRKMSIWTDYSAWKLKSEFRNENRSAEKRHASTWLEQMKSNKSNFGNFEICASFDCFLVAADMNFVMQSIAQCSLVRFGFVLFCFGFSFLFFFFQEISEICYKYKLAERQKGSCCHSKSGNVHIWTMPILYWWASIIVCEWASVCVVVQPQSAKIATDSFRIIINKFSVN